MRNTLAKVLGAALGLGLIAAPGFASTAVLNFSGTTGTWEVCATSACNTGSFTGGDNYDLGAVTGLYLSTMELGLGTDVSLVSNGTGGCSGGSANGAELELSGTVGGAQTLTLYGSSSSLTGLTSGCNELVQLTGDFTGKYTSGSSGQFSYAGITGVGYINPTLLTDEGYTGGSATFDTGAFNAISGASGTGTTTYTTNSDSLAVNLMSPVATPEPWSFSLAGLGLGLVMLVARRNRSRTECVAAAGE